MSGHCLLALLTGSVSSHVHRSCFILPPLPPTHPWAHGSQPVSRPQQVRQRRWWTPADPPLGSSCSMRLSCLISPLKRLRDASDLGRKLTSLGGLGASEERRERKVLSISCSCLQARLGLSHPRKVWVLFFVQTTVSVIGCEKCFLLPNKKNR